MRPSTTRRITALGLLLTALVASGGTCGGASPTGSTLPGAGRVTLRIENQTGCPVVVDTDFAVIGGEIRRTTRRLSSDGAESAANLLPTQADTINIRAIADPSSVSASSCEVEDQRELVFQRDFEDGSELLIVLRAVAPPPPPPPPPQPTPPVFDCNNNGVEDATDIASGTSRDCNCNNIPDECDISVSRSGDQDGNGVPDECERCVPLDVVFVMDTSGSIGNEAGDICQAMVETTTQLAQQGVVARATLLAIFHSSSPRPPAFTCLTGSVDELLGAEVPGNPPCCPAIATVEDWGPATAVVAGRFGWLPQTTRVIIAVSDEAPQGGDPCQDPGADRDSIEVAKALALANKVAVGVILAQGEKSQAACYTSLAEELAQVTGGSVLNSFPHDSISTELSTALQAIQTSHCTYATNCPQ